MRHQVVEYVRAVLIPVCLILITGLIAVELEFWFGLPLVDCVAVMPPTVSGCAL